MKDENPEVLVCSIASECCRPLEPGPGFLGCVFFLFRSLRFCKNCLIIFFVSPRYRFGICALLSDRCWAVFGPFLRYRTFAFIRVLPVRSCSRSCALFLTDGASVSRRGSGACFERCCLVHRSGCAARRLCDWTAARHIHAPGLSEHLWICCGTLHRKHPRSSE